MKRILSFCALALPALLFFSSCQKEVEDIFLNQTQADSSYLHRYIALDTTQPVGADTTEKGFFSYDGQKRLVRYAFVSVGFTDTVSYEFRYSGTDTLPYLEIMKQYHGGPGMYSLDSVFYTYTNAVVKKDSAVNWVYPGPANAGSVVADFTVAGTTVKRYDRYYDFIAGIYVLAAIDSGTYTVGYTAGNLSSQALTHGTGYFVSVNATYDNKPNPLGKAIKVRYPNFEGYFLDGWGNQINNPIQVLSQSSGNPAQTEQFTYTYRADGFPTIVRYFDSGGFSSHNKVFYYYTAL